MSDALDPESIFSFLEPLGVGSYGQVYKAIDRRTGILVAVKVLNLDPTNREAITEEVSIMQRFRHPNIVNLRDHFIKGEMLWIAIEYCGGGSVLDLMQALERPLDEPQCAVVLRETLQGLTYLHGERLIHRDVKGANILVDHSGRCKVGDFGISAQLFHSASKRGTQIGSPYWMAPEMFGSDKYDKKVDVWALGISAIEMATMDVPHCELRSLGKVIRAICTPPPPQLAASVVVNGVTLNFSADFQDFVRQCLVFDPEARPAATDLIHHPFIQGAGPLSVVSNLVYDALPILVDQRREKRERQQAEDGLVGGGTGPTTVVDNSLSSSGKLLSDTMIVRGSPSATRVGTVLVHGRPNTWEHSLKHDPIEVGTVVIHGSLSKSLSSESGRAEIVRRSVPVTDAEYASETMIVHTNSSLIGRGVQPPDEIRRLVSAE